jgi:hypothetical protein
MTMVGWSATQPQEAGDGVEDPKTLGFFGFTSGEVGQADGLREGEEAGEISGDNGGVIAGAGSLIQKISCL